MRPPLLRMPCILVRVHRAVDQFVVTGRLRLINGSRGLFHTGRNEPSFKKDEHFDWATAKTFVAPELSDDVNDAFVFAHPADAAAFMFHFAGGGRVTDWSTRSPGQFRPGEYVTGEIVPALMHYLRVTGAGGPEDPTPSQIWMAYRTLIRAGLADDLPDAEWIRERIGDQP